MIGEPRVATEERYFLAEGPFWDAARRRLHWVDIRNGLVLEGILESDGTITETGRVQLPSTAGAVAVSASGELLIAGSDRLHIQAADGVVTEGPILIDDPTSTRLNDGKPDPQGRYVVGTLRLDGESSSERLVLVDGMSVVVLDDDLTLSNGLAWTADGAQLYSIDTMRRTVFRRPWGEAGPTGPRETFVVLDDGYPDGMTIDAADHLWVALWGLGQVHRYSPDGRLVATVDIPAPHVSSVAFAGPDLQTLVITTSVQDLSTEQLARYPDSGRLFTIHLDIAGQPQHLWAGSATTHAERTP